MKARAIDIQMRQPTEFKNGNYWCTPLNTLEFAGTGVDGEHFSFLVQDYRINAKSPVVYTAPCNYVGENNIIIAPNFKTFLSLGIRHGFFALGNVLDSPTNALQKYTCEPEPPLASNPQISLEPKQRQMLNFIAQALELSPCLYSIDEFIQLQLRFLP